MDENYRDDFYFKHPRLCHLLVAALNLFAVAALFQNAIAGDFIAQVSG